jgi:hypothetical protein
VKSKWLVSELVLAALLAAAGGAVAAGAAGAAPHEATASTGPGDEELRRIALQALASAQDVRFRGVFDQAALAIERGLDGSAAVWTSRPVPGGGLKMALVRISGDTVETHFIHQRAAGDRLFDPLVYRLGADGAVEAVEPASASLDCTMCKTVAGATLKLMLEMPIVYVPEVAGVVCGAVGLTTGPLWLGCVGVVGATSLVVEHLSTQVPSQYLAHQICHHVARRCDRLRYCEGERREAAGAELYVAADLPRTSSLVPGVRLAAGRPVTLEHYRRDAQGTLAYRDTRTFTEEYVSPLDALAGQRQRWRAEDGQGLLLRLADDRVVVIEGGVTGGAAPAGGEIATELACY